VERGRNVKRKKFIRNEKKEIKLIKRKKIKIVKIK
jgi:hypothetical protein